MSPKKQIEKNEHKPAIERESIENKFKWDLRPVFKDDEEFEKSLEELSTRIQELSTFQGKISESGEILLKYFDLRDVLYQHFERLLTYSRLKQDMDTRASKYRGYVSKTNDLWSEIRQNTSWYAPELLQIPWETIEQWFVENGELSVYRHYLEDEYRVKEHVLSHPEEKIMALASKMNSSPGEIFSAFNNADIGGLFPSVIDDDGNEIQLSHANYSAYLESGSSRLRKEAYFGYQSAYSNFLTTLSSSLKAVVERDVFIAQSRKYNSSLESSLSGDNVSIDVYNSLISAVHASIKPLHKYVGLRKKILNLPEIHIYDMYASLFPEVTDKIDYREARSLVLDSLAILGNEYTESLNKAFNSRWIDVYENRGKASGAYSWGMYTVHPFVLLNYNETLNDVFTIAHELGHAMHSLYTAKNQPYIYGDYSIFAAEVASTFNEALLINFLLKKNNDRLKKLNLIARYINNFTGTLITQTMFAEFELKIHQMVENGVPLTPDSLSETYLELVKLYYGNNMTYEDLNGINWCRIPHFYYNFYVYKYATSFSASSVLARKILQDEEGALDKYLLFLSSGSSDYPIELLDKAGVDMRTPEPVKEAMKLFGGLVNQLETMID